MAFIKSSGVIKATAACAIVPLMYARAEAGTWYLNQTIIHDSQERSYDYYVPDSLNGPRPLVVVLHGNGGSSSFISSCSGIRPLCRFAAEADSHKFYIVAPQGLDGENGGAYWNDCRDMAGDTHDDVDFIEQVIDDMGVAYDIEPKRIFAAGHSNGGAMALRLAEESSYFSAVASISGGMTTSAASECTHSNVNSTGILMINGTDDSFVPYGGGEIQTEIGGYVRPVEDAISYWVNFNSTDTAPITENLPDVNTVDSSTVTSYLYGNGDNDTAVRLYKVVGGEHSEPGIAEQYPHWIGDYGVKQNHDIESAEVIWGFFDLH